MTSFTFSALIVHSMCQQVCSRALSKYNINSSRNHVIKEGAIGCDATHSYLTIKVPMARLAML